jgi:preprotein translocase subunit SecA
LVGYFLKQVFGTKNARTLKALRPLVARIGDLEPSMQSKSDAELKALTPVFRQRLANGEKLDALLPEAFAVVREAGKRVLNMRHFDVQLVCGMVLHRGSFAEM